jgi:methyl-accepting chemotaxis protein
MNDRNKGGSTINALLIWGTVISVLISIICLVVVGLVAATTFPIAPVVGTCVVIIIVGVIANIMLRSRINDRLLSLADVCRNYVGGDRSIRAAVNGDDEMAQLATSLNTLLDRQNFTSSNAPAAPAPGSSDAAALQAQIEKLLQEVSAVGDGDLRVQAEVTPDTLGVLADSFNYMIEELAKVVGRVQNTAVQVTNASRRVLDRSAELAQASETQVARISQTTQAVEALATFVQDVAHNARVSAEASQDALQNAKAGQSSVRQSIEGMQLIRENVQETSKKIKRLGERSNEIGEIVRIIEDIADQTNLLALNAAIQSAMAGEHGRGFAVVADEIRLLAERSTESTKRIATLVKSIQGDTYEAVVAMEDSTQEVVKGSQLADEVGRALNSIYNAVERQARSIETIAQAANEQASVSEDVANAMTEISEITNRTNAGTQEAAMSVSYLSELSDQLRASVSTFRLPERANESVEAFSSVGSGVPALPGASSDADGGFFQQDSTSLNSDWNQNFSADFLSLPQPQENDMAGAGFQFALNGQKEPSGFTAGMPQLPAGPQGLPQGFGSGLPSAPARGPQSFSGPLQGFPPSGPQGLPGGLPSFDSQPFGNGNSLPGFGNQPGFGEMNPFESQQNFGQQGLPQSFGQQGFGQQQFGGLPDSGFGQASAPSFPPSNQMPAAPAPNFAPPPMGNPVPGRPRWNGAPQGQGPVSFNPEQMPFPGSGNGHMGQ